MRSTTASASQRFRAHVDELRQGAAYRNYVAVREEVLRMLDQEQSAAAVPSAYWEEELAGFEYMLDASPLIVEKLRHHSYHLTGLRVYDYRSNRDVPRAQLKKKLALLVRAAGGSDLLVPEARELGGFGFEIDGSLYNVDTLKFFEVLIGLQRSSILASLRESERPVVWEIGAGWGGFAYQLKTLMPELTYVVSDLPPVILYSATYLKTLFPGADVRFVHAGEALPADVWSADFVFVPHTLTDRVRPPRLDLALNMVSFQEMTTEQVDAYARHAYEAGASYLYSLNRDCSPYNREQVGVRSVLQRYFWLHHLQLMPMPYTKMTGDPRARKRPKENDPAAYRHVYGFSRIRP